MALPYLITCEEPAVDLYELGDKRFQLIQSGPIAPLMSGHGYLVAENVLAVFVEALGIAGLQVEPAILLDRGTGQEHRSHMRLHVSQRFFTDQIHELALDGLRMLCMADRYYFVSPELKRRLQTAPFPYLRFSEGLSGFAGN